MRNTVAHILSHLSQLRTLSSLSSFSFLSRRHWKVNQWVALGQRTQAMDAVEQLLVAGGNDARRVAEIAVQVSEAGRSGAERSGAGRSEQRYREGLRMEAVAGEGLGQAGIGTEETSWGHVCDLGRSVCVCVCCVPAAYQWVRAHVVYA